MRRGEDVERTQKRSNRRGPRHGGHHDVVLQTDAQFGRSIDDGQIFVKNRTRTYGIDDTPAYVARITTHHVKRGPHGPWCLWESQ